MIVEENIDLAPRTTLGVGGPARWLTTLTREEQVPEAVNWARERNLPWMVLGGGSNLLVADRGFDGLVMAMRIRGRRFVEDEDGFVSAEAGAGEGWDDFVAASIGAGGCGLECLSGIPGTVGATPVQNVGAYGQEVSDTLAWVRAWDTRAEQWVELESPACGFAYRVSRFNSGDTGRFVITSVHFRLRVGRPARPQYPELERKLAGVEAPTLQQIRDTVREVRQAKGMLLVEGEAESHSAGSFFKNPVMPGYALPELIRRAGATPPQYAAGDGQVKVPAAWLLEQAGFTRGYRLPGSGAGISSRHVLALINYNRTSCADILALARAMQRGVEERFGIRLRAEPVAVGFKRDELL